MFLNNYKQEGIHQKGGMTSIKGQTKNLGFNPKPNYNFLPSGDKLNFLDSANYQYDFYNTPLLGTTPSRVDMKVPAYNSDYSDPSYQNYSDLQWLMNHSLPHSRYHFYNDGKDNLYKRTVEESNAYEDYLNQFFNHAGKLINSNPNMKHFLNKATPFKFKKGGIFYQDGGMTDAEAKVFYKNPRYVKSLADAERQGFIGPENYPPELEGERRPFIGPRQEMDRMQMVPAPELLRNDSGLPRQPLFIPKPVVRQAPRRKPQPRANNNAEMAKIAGIRMAYLDMMNPKNFAKKPQVNKVQYSDIYPKFAGKRNNIDLPERSKQNGSVTDFMKSQIIKANIKAAPAIKEYRDAVQNMRAGSDTFSSKEGFQKDIRRGIQRMQETPIFADEKDAGSLKGKSLGRRLLEAPVTTIASEFGAPPARIISGQGTPWDYVGTGAALLAGPMVKQGIKYGAQTLGRIGDAIKWGKGIKAPLAYTSRMRWDVPAQAQIASGKTMLNAGPTMLNPAPTMLNAAPKMLKAAPRLINAPTNASRQMIEYENFMKWASKAAKNPTQLKKLKKIFNQTKNLGFE